MGNGGTCARYSWTQTLGDVTVVFPLPAGTASRDVRVEIKATSIAVSSPPASATPLLAGRLHKRVKAEDSLWTLEDDGRGGRQLSVLLTKEHGMEWWSCVAEGEPTIDVSRVEPENSTLSDLDADTRTTVEKMMFDQRQKALGLPSSDDLRKQETMAKFIAAHPEMDFSQAKFT